MVTFGAASVVVAPLIDFFIASYLAEGSRTALYYADRINQLPLGVLGIALGTVLLPEMSTRLAKGDRAGSDAAQNRSAALTLLLTLPFAAAFIAIPGTIMRAVFAHGAFNAHAASLAALALAAYGAGLPAMALVRIVASTFYARHDTMTPARATVTAIVANIALKVLFVWGLHLGVAGVALGTALGAWINVAILTWSGKSQTLLAIETAFVRALPPVLLAAIATGAGAWLGARAASLVVQGHLADMAGLAAAIVCAGLCLWRGGAAVPEPVAVGPAGAMRLFVALAIPAPVAQSIMLIQGGVPGARWQTREQLHLTLRFIGEVDGRDAAMLDDALAGIEAPGFDASTAWRGPVRQQAAACAVGGGAAEPGAGPICSARWTMPSAASANRKTHTNSPPHVTLARLRHPEPEQGDRMAHPSRALYQPRIPGWRVSALFQQAHQRRQHLYG